VSDGVMDDELQFDHSDPEMGARLHETYAAFRSKCPIPRGEKFGGFWALTRYEDVLKAARDYSAFTVTQGITIPHINGEVPVLPAQADPPEHTAYRRIVQKFFTPTAMVPYEAILRDLARTQLATIADAGEADLIPVLCRPIPPTAIALMFGLPIEEAGRFVDWADRMMATAYSGNKDEHDRVIDELETYLEVRCLERRGHDDGTVLAAIANATLDGRLLTSVEIRGLTHLLAIAGHETTVNSLSTLLYHIITEPGLKRRLIDDPGAIPATVEEALRYEAPVMSMARTVVKETVLGDHAFCPGDRVLLAFISANHDESVFERPEEFDVARPNMSSHLAFGSGTHRCLGEHLARSEMRVVAEEVLRWMPDIDLVPGYSPEWLPARTVRGLRALPVSYTPFSIEP
jgi:cytochrome P450